MTGWLLRLLGYCWRHRGRLLLAVGASMLGMAAAGVAPLLQRFIVDDVIVDPSRELWPLATGCW